MKKKAVGSKTKLTNPQKVTIIVALIGGTCAVFTALVGLGMPVVEKFLDVFVKVPTSIPILPTYTPAPSPTPIVIYKSPEEMNLRPGDVPDFHATEIQNPSETPLLPEATSQSQLAYKNESQDIYVESNVLIVPSENQRAPHDIVILVLSERIPTAVLEQNEQSVEVGNKGAIFAFQDSLCGSGYVLIAERNNVIILLIGCGKEIEVATLENIAIIIDKHITISREDDCAQLNLSSAQCANHGTHQYSFSRDVVSYSTNTVSVLCTYGKLSDHVTHQQGEITETILFTQFGSNVTFNNNPISNSSKIGLNSYYSEFPPPEEGDIDTGTYTFSENGFVFDELWKSPDGTSCKYHEEYILINH